MRFLYCPRHGALPAYYHGLPTDSCPICRELEDPNIRAFVEEGGSLAELALIAVFGVSREEVAAFSEAVWGGGEDDAEA